METCSRAAATCNPTVQAAAALRGKQRLRHGAQDLTLQPALRGPRLSSPRCSFMPFHTLDALETTLVDNESVVIHVEQKT